MFYQEMDRQYMLDVREYFVVALTYELRSYVCNMLRIGVVYLFIIR